MLITLDLGGDGGGPLGSLGGLLRSLAARAASSLGRSFVGGFRPMVAVDDFGGNFPGGPAGRDLGTEKERDLRKFKTMKPDQLNAFFNPLLLTFSYPHLDLREFFLLPCFGEQTEQLSSEHELTLSLPDPLPGLLGRPPDFDNGLEGGVCGLPRAGGRDEEADFPLTLRGGEYDRERDLPRGRDEDDGNGGDRGPVLYNNIRNHLRRCRKALGPRYVSV